MDDLRPGRLFVFGLGYSMTRLARRLRDLGWQVAGTTRDADRLERLQDEGFDAHAFGPDQPLDTAALAGTTHLIQSISPEDSGDPAVPALAEALRALPQLRWAGYLSTPSVYGDRGGAWIDESADPTPGSPRGWKRLESERAWFGAFQSTGVAVQVFRLAGIYGPGRSALDQLRHGRARRIDKPGQVFNRIHV
ncbi:MAG TPA: SDR family NAD(P)-dependent oxidoreductase, partial [Inquilinus sp.]